MSELDLDAIRERWERLHRVWVNVNDWRDFWTDMPALIAEVERLRALVENWRNDSREETEARLALVQRIEALIWEHMNSGWRVVQLDALRALLKESGI